MQETGGQGGGSTLNDLGSLAESSAGWESACEADPWGWWRNHMPITRKWAYFDHAAVGPLSGPAAASIAQFTAEAAYEGDTVWPQWAGRVEGLRRNAAELLAADPAEVCMIPNTTTGIGMVAEGYPWQHGDNVVIPEGEFPSNVFPWMNQQAKGVELRVVPRRDGAVIVDDLLAHADEATRIIAVSWVGYASGYRVDLASLVERAHERGILVFVDAIQGLGMYPLDCREIPIDFLAADGHKWLLGPEGAGVAYIRREHLDRLRCTMVGWNSVKNAHNFARPTLEVRDDAAKFEGGSANMVGLGALSASLEMFLQVRRCHGPEAISRRVVELAENLDHRLRQIGISSRLPAQSEHRSGILTFEVPGVPASAVREAAFQRHVVLSCRDGGVRASLHVYNNDDDLDRLIEAIQASVSM